MHLFLLGNANRMTLSLSAFLVEMQPSGTLCRCRQNCATCLAVIIMVTYKIYEEIMARLG